MDLFICSECGANLIEHGIKEVLSGGITETLINFSEIETKEGIKKEAKIEHPETTDFDEQWIVCLSCEKELHDRTAVEIIEAFENNFPHEMEE